MAQMRFDALVTALADAVVQAEHVVRLHQISDLRSFFDANNQPVSVPIQIPRTDPDARSGDLTKLEVPLITLINVGHLSIKDMEIRFETELGEVSEHTDRRPHTYPAGEGGVPFSVDPTPDPYESTTALGWSGDRAVKAVQVSTSASDDHKRGGCATITLRVHAGETPEGLARLIARLNQAI